MVIPKRSDRKYEPYPEYKDSGIEWLGKIPTYWEVKPLKRVLKVFNGSTPKSSEPEYWDGHAAERIVADIASWLKIKNANQ